MKNYQDNNLKYSKTCPEDILSIQRSASGGRTCIKLQSYVCAGIYANRFNVPPGGCLPKATWKPWVYRILGHFLTSISAHLSGPTCSGNVEVEKGREKRENKITEFICPPPRNIFPESPPDTTTASTTFTPPNDKRSFQTDA